VQLVESTAPNPKITVPGDLAYLEMLLRKGL
jgi:2-C-methyl-D-erythritol 4-phosphate cytidylyltransferase